MPEPEENKCAECEQPAQLKCSACKVVWYCNKEHQKQHWKIHKSACRSYEICKSEELGRYLIATRDLSPGDIILCEPPLVYGPRPYPIEEGPIPCVGCCKLIAPDTTCRCINCGWQLCDASCVGVRNVTAHAQECPMLCLRPAQAVNNVHNFYRQDSILALRCLLLQRQGVKKWKQLFELESHFDKRGKDTEIYQTLDQRVVKYILENFITPLKQYEQKTGNTVLHDVSEETLHKICGIIDVNALESNQNIDISGLYLTAALMEHNCISNTFHYFGDDLEQYRITVKAACPIKKGEHLTTMYTHALWGTQARREHLKETKYFVCNCQRCSDPTELGTYLSALRCLGGATPEACTGTQLPLNPLDDKTEWGCSDCPVRITNTQVAEIINQIGEEVDSVQANKPTVRDLESLLAKMLKLLHPHHYHVYSVKHSLLQLYGYQQGYLTNQLSDELLIKKKEMCKELLEITVKIDPGNARLSLYLGVIYHEYHLATMDLIKRQWNSGDKQALTEQIHKAREFLVRAQESLKNEIAMGAGVKLAHLICDSLKDFGRWMDNKGVSLGNATAGEA